MTLDFSPEDETFRAEVRAFIAANFPAELRRKQDAREELNREDYLGWHKILARRGWAAPSWPVDYGGPGWTAVQTYIFADELARAYTTIAIAWANISSCGAFWADRYALGNSCGGF